MDHFPTWSQRFFRPAFVSAVGEFYVLVDVVQPVAVVISTEGIVLRVCSWVDLLGPPEHATWPHRTVATSADGVVVQDLWTERQLDIRIIDAAGDVDIGVDRIDVPKLKAMPRVSSRFSRGSRAPIVLGAQNHWLVSSHLDRFRWSSSMSVDGPDGLRSTFRVDGSVTDCAAGRSGAVMCVREANKRPWQFDPPYSAFLAMDRGEPDLTVIDLPKPDITSSCWPRRTDSSDSREWLPGHLAITLNELAHLQVVAGGYDSSITVDGLDGTADLRIRSSFRLPRHADTQFCRSDRPIDEFGNLQGGHKALNISLVEDFEGGVFDDLLRSAHTNDNDRVVMV